MRRYQLGIPVWRALGGPVEIELGGVMRVLTADRSAVLFDVRPAAQFAQGSLPGALHAPLEDILTGKAKMALPEDDFNRRIILMGNGADAQAGGLPGQAALAQCLLLLRRLFDAGGSSEVTGHEPVKFSVAN